MAPILRWLPAVPRAQKHNCTEWTTIGGEVGDAVVNPGLQPFDMDPTARPNPRQRVRTGFVQPVVRSPLAMALMVRRSSGSRAWAPSVSPVLSNERHCCSNVIC